MKLLNLMKIELFIGLIKEQLLSLSVKNLLGKTGFNHKYHLIKLGKSEDVIEKEMEEFLARREKDRDVKKR